MEKKIKFRPIGEKFQMNEVTLEVVVDRGNNCKGCFFESNDIIRCHRSDGLAAGYCSMLSRRDGKSVIFKDITTNNTKNEKKWEV